MSPSTPVYAEFLGLWLLIPETCRYQQGEPPRSASYRISVQGEVPLFSMAWVDAEGEAHELEFSCKADGERHPFAGGELADALSVTAVSRRELNSSAYLNGRELMVAQRQLDDTGMAMRITQVVRLPDGSRPANVSIYRRAD